MARPRAQSSVDISKEPHSVSLKVLRLSRPSLLQRHPLPQETPHISPLAALAYPSAESDQQFILSSNLTLPTSFGSAHVGETFSCSLCANNELPNTPLESALSQKAVTNLRMVAEMQTPSQSVPLPLHTAAPNSPATQAVSQSGLLPGSSHQVIVHFELKEEGTHVLAVNLSYTETTSAFSSTRAPAKDPSVPAAATSGRLRTFRKLYQFQAMPAISVRTKATELAPASLPTNNPGHDILHRYVLEAQLENVSQGGGVIVLESAKLQARPPFQATSLNWDLDFAPPASHTEEGSTPPVRENPRLATGDVLQVAFLVEQQQLQAGGMEDGLTELKENLKREGRAVLGQLAIEWRSSMGDRGVLSTGNLMTRRKIS